MPSSSAGPKPVLVKFLSLRHLDANILTPLRSRHWYILSVILGALPILLALAFDYWRDRPSGPGYAAYALPLLLLPPCALALLHGVTGAFGIWSLRKTNATSQQFPSCAHAPSFLGAFALSVLLNVLDLCSELDQESRPAVLWEQHLPAPGAVGLLAAFYLAQTLAAFFTLRLAGFILVSNVRLLRATWTKPAASHRVATPALDFGQPRLAFDAQFFSFLVVGLAILLSTRLRNATDAHRSLVAIVGPFIREDLNDPNGNGEGVRQVVHSISRLWDGPFNDLGQLVLFAGWTAMGLVVLLPALARWSPNEQSLAGTSMWPFGDVRGRVWLFLSVALWVYNLVPKRPQFTDEFVLYAAIIFFISLNASAILVRLPSWLAAWLPPASQDSVKPEEMDGSRRRR